MKEQKNLKYKTTEDWKYESEPCGKKELKEARREGKKLIEQVTLRSCWICNAAHYHFLKGKWGKWLLNCFDCGRFFYNKIDITEYE